MKISENSFNYSLFSYRLKECMKFAGFKEFKELSEKTYNKGKRKCDISTVSLSNWINGKYEPSRTSIIILAEALGVNPQYLTGESDFPAIKTEKPKKEIVRNKSTGSLEEQIKPYRIGKDYFDFIGLLEEGIKRRTEHAETNKARIKVIDVLHRLGYYFLSEGTNLYLNIPEERKIAIPHYEQWVNMEKGLPISEAERDFLLLQLESILDLFEKTIINYYTSNMAAFNMIDHAQLESYQKKESFNDGLTKMHHVAPEEKEYWHNYFRNLPTDNQENPQGEHSETAERQSERISDVSPKPEKKKATKRKK